MAVTSKTEPKDAEVQTESALLLRHARDAVGFAPPSLGAEANSSVAKRRPRKRANPLIQREGA